MVEVQVDVWAKIRLQHWWRRGIIGHNSRGMLAIIRGSVQFAKLPRVNLKILVYTCLCLFHKHHGRIYLWTLYWVFLEPNMVWIFFFLLWLTGTQRCPISQHARRLQMLLEWPICSFRLLKYGPFQITKKINNNAFVVAFSPDMSISSTFNVADLYDYYPLDEPDSGNSGSSSFQVGETDVEQIAHAFLKQQGHMKSQRKIKGGCQQGPSG